MTFDKIANIIPMDVSEVVDYFSLEDVQSSKNFAMLYLDEDGREWGAIVVDGYVESGGCGYRTASELVRGKLKGEW